MRQNFTLEVPKRTVGVNFMYSSHVYVDIVCNSKDIDQH